MGYASGDAPPTWYRLSEESWAEIRRDYQNGATARELASRWRVSAGSIYRHACAEGWTKKRSADAVARASAAAVAAEEQADLEGAQPAPRSSGPAAALERAALFRPEAGEAREGAADLSAAAVQAAGRAMRRGRLDEAQALARLAETLARVATKAPDSLLETVYRAVLEPGYATSVMGIWGEPNPDPIKRAYWEAMAERARERQAREREEWKREDAAREAREAKGAAGG